MTKTCKSPSKKKKLPAKKTGRSKGQPTKFQDKYIHFAYVACKEGGFTDLKLAELFKVSKATINNWKKDYPHFLDSIKKGKDEWDCASAEKSMLKRVVGFRYTETTREANIIKGGLSITKKVSKFIPPDVKACDIWLCNRNPKRWRKLKHVELTGKDGSALFANLSDKELDERIAAKLAESGNE